MTYQHNIFFPNKRYMTYKCLRELLMTDAAACTSVVKMIKSVVYLHMFTNISQQAVQHDFIRCS